MKRAFLVIPAILVLFGCSKRGFVINFNATAPATDNYQRSMDGKVYEKYYTASGLSVGFTRAFNLIKDELLKMGQADVKP